MNIGHAFWMKPPSSASEAKTRHFVTMFSVLPKNNSRHDGRVWFGCGLWSHRCFWALSFPTSKKSLSWRLAGRTCLKYTGGKHWCLISWCMLSHLDFEIWWFHVDKNRLQRWQTRLYYESIREESWLGTHLDAQSVLVLPLCTLVWGKYCRWLQYGGDMLY